MIVSHDPSCEEARAILKGAHETKGTFNDLKNRSLYADFYDDGFWMPSEYIPTELAESILEIAKFAVLTIQAHIEGDLIRRGRAQGPSC